MTDRNRYAGPCPTAKHIIVAYLWEEYPRWVPAHELVKLDMPYGYVGNSGDVRARELARNEIPEKYEEGLKNKVERADGRDIGLDPRFTYFRYKPSKPPMTRDQHLQAAKKATEWFDDYQQSVARTEHAVREGGTLLAFGDVLSTD